MSNRYKHPNSHDLYTPVTPQLIGLMERMCAEYGSWRKVAEVSGLRLRKIRRYRRLGAHVVPFRILDILTSTTGIGSVHEFTWFTAEDLVRLGIWKPHQYVVGNKRVRSHEQEGWDVWEESDEDGRDS